MKKQILMVDQWGSCDRQGRPIGHSVKVLHEYDELLQEVYDVSIAVPESMIADIKQNNFENIHLLPYSICEEQPQKIAKRIRDKKDIFSNIRDAWNQSGYDIIWFYRGDIFLLFYALFHKKKKNAKYVCLLCQNQLGRGFIGKITDVIYKYGVRRFDGVIYTQKKMAILTGNTFYMPDYFYDDKYECYSGEEKEEKAVCVGTMNGDKDLEGMVNVFNQCGYPLEICGHFLDRDRYVKLKEMAFDNIIIDNRILSRDEFYTKIAQAKYSIIPYKMQAYSGRTSGVLQESVFLNTIPVAPKKLLEENEICGVGYSQIDDLVEIIHNFPPRVEGKQRANDLEATYSKIVIQNGLCEWMDRL